MSWVKKIAVKLAGAALTVVTVSVVHAATLYVGNTVTATGTGGSQTYNVITSPYTGNPSNGTISPTSTFELGNSFNETVSGITYAPTGADFNLYPGSSLGANCAPSGPCGNPWNFQDDYYFSLSPGATVQASVISNSMSNIEDLQVRLIYAAGNTVSATNPVLGPPAGGTVLDAWQTLNLGGGSINLTMPANASPSSYILQVRGEDESDLAGSYGGTISFTPAAALPLPAGLPLLLSGLAGLGCLFRIRRAALST
jgi:hypothetical protein